MIVLNDPKAAAGRAAAAAKLLSSQQSSPQSQQPTPLPTSFLILGNSASGKTTLRTRLQNKNDFQNDYVNGDKRFDPTIGVDFSSVDDELSKQIFDNLKRKYPFPTKMQSEQFRSASLLATNLFEMVGGSRFRTLTMGRFSNYNGAILVYDFVEEQQLQNLINRNTNDDDDDYDVENDQNGETEEEHNIRRIKGFIQRDVQLLSEVIQTFGRTATSRPILILINYKHNNSKDTKNWLDVFDRKIAADPVEKLLLDSVVGLEKCFPFGNGKVEMCNLYDTNCDRVEKIFERFLEAALVRKGDLIPDEELMKKKHQVHREKRKSIKVAGFYPSLPELMKFFQ
jgi:hypothetical protein